MGQKKSKSKGQDQTIQTNTPKPTNKQINSATSSELKYIVYILLATFIVFFPSLKNDYVNWDDDRNVFENNDIKELNAKSIKTIFTTDVIGNYNPLPIFTFAVEHHFFGMNPKVMHTTNLILHLFCTAMVYLIFRRLGLSILFAFIGGLLFGIHPLRVESVAWITERKDVLYASFFLPALWLYIKNLDEYKFSRSVWIFILFAIGLFAKIQMVALPLSFIAVDYYKSGELNLKMFTGKWLYFIAAFAFGLLGIHFLQTEGSLDGQVDYGLIQRLFIGSYSFIVYLIKWLVPYRMLPLYPYDPKLSPMHYVSMPIAIAIGIAAIYAFKKGYKALVFGFFFFFFNIVFLLQILGAGQGYLADRFTYIAYFGLFFIFCYYLQEWYTNNQSQQTLVMSSLGIYLLFFAYLSFKQCHYWQNSDTLWSREIEFYDNTPLPYNNRANYYRDKGQLELALKDYNRAIELKAGHSTYNSRARLFFNKNEDARAIEDYNKAISLMPKAEYYVNRGAAYAKLGQMDKALEDLNKGLEIDPNWKVGYLNRSILWNNAGKFDLALKDIDAYLRLEPKNAELWYEGGRCLRAMNNPNKAIEYYSNAIRINPKFGLFYLERGRTYQTLGNAAAANADLSTARQMGEKVE